jgi:hypothetical protein
MPGTMNEADLVADLKASLNEAASVFTAASDADFKRQLAAAAVAFGAKRPRTLVGSITLVAEQAQYDPPAGLQGVKSHLWGIAPRMKAQPWDKTWTGRLPDLRLVEGATPAARKLQLDPAPTAHQISALGAELRFYYYGVHAIGADAANTSILPGDRQLLLLRAQAEAMRELAARNIQRPVIVREAVGSQTRNGTPSALYEKFLQEFREAA